MLQGDALPDAGPEVRVGSVDRDVVAGSERYGTRMRARPLRWARNRLASARLAPASSLFHRNFSASHDSEPDRVGADALSAEQQSREKAREQRGRPDEETTLSEQRPTRRGVLNAVGGISAAMAFGVVGVLSTASPASAAGDHPSRIGRHHRPAP